MHMATNVSILNIFLLHHGKWWVPNHFLLTCPFQTVPRSYVPFQLGSALPSATPMKTKKLHPWCAPYVSAMSRYAFRGGATDFYQGWQS